MLSRYLNISLLCVSCCAWLACGEPLAPADRDEPLSLSQAPLALTQNSDGDWGWADRRVTSPDLTAVWGAAANDVWAVGAGSATLHWNGTTWRRIPNPGAGATILALWGTASNNIYAVGDNGLAMRWNGTAWRRLDLPTPSGVALNDIWGSAANDIWVVGDDGVVVRYNGTGWVPVATTGDNSLWAVWGSAANNVLMTGELGYMLRWNGTALSEVSSGGTSLYIRLRGANANKAWMLEGSYNQVLSWDGTRWTAPSSTPVASLSAQNIFVVNENSVWFVSSSYGAFRWNGTTSTRYSEAPGNAMWLSGSDGWVVGNSARLSRYNGTDFSTRW